jgi:hypothetical protein
MNDGKGMNVFESSQHLIQERLNVFGRKILRRHDELVKIRIDICKRQQNNSSSSSILKSVGDKKQRLGRDVDTIP